MRETTYIALNTMALKRNMTIKIYVDLNLPVHGCELNTFLRHKPNRKIRFALPPNQFVVFVVVVVDADFYFWRSTTRILPCLTLFYTLDFVFIRITNIPWAHTYATWSTLYDFFIVRHHIRIVYYYIQCDTYDARSHVAACTVHSQHQLKRKRTKNK